MSAKSIQNADLAERAAVKVSEPLLLFCYISCRPNAPLQSVFELLNGTSFVSLTSLEVSGNSRYLAKILRVHHAFSAGSCCTASSVGCPITACNLLSAVWALSAGADCQTGDIVTAQGENSLCSAAARQLFELESLPAKALPRQPALSIPPPGLLRTLEASWWSRWSSRTADCCSLCIPIEAVGLGLSVRGNPPRLTSPSTEGVSSF